MFPYWKNSFVSIFRDLALLCSQSFLWRFDNLSLQHYVPLNAKFIEIIYWTNTNFPIYMESSKKLYKLKPPVYLGPIVYKVVLFEQKFVRNDHSASVYQKSAKTKLKHYTTIEQLNIPDLCQDYCLSREN